MSNPHNDDADRLLRSLARLAHEQEQEQADGEPIDSLWEALSPADLPPEERRRRAERAKEDPDLQALHGDAHILDEAFHAEIVANVERRMQADARARRNIRIWGLALAASLLLALGVLNQLDRAAALPRYTHTWQGGMETSRGGDAASTDRPQLHDGTAVTLIAAPENTVDGPIEVRGFLLVADRLHPWPEAARHAQIAGTGAVRLHVTLGRELVLPRGEATLLLAIGRPDELPGTAELERVLGQGSPKRPWRLIRQVVDVIDQGR